VVISDAYIGIAVALTIIAGVVWRLRGLMGESRSDLVNPLAALSLLKRTRFAFGMLCIFLYVGAEVAIGSILVNYLMLTDTLGLGSEDAGKHVAFYWGGAMVGRFIGAALLRMFSPGKILTCAACMILLLLAISANSVGAIAGWSLLAVGLFNSIMFPTIFSLASEKLGARAAEGSGLICVAIVGGAVVPPLMGVAADLTSLAASLIVPAVCYAGIASFGWYARKPAQA